MNLKSTSPVANKLESKCPQLHRTVSNFSRSQIAEPQTLMVMLEISMQTAVGNIEAQRDVISNFTN